MVQATVTKAVLPLWSYNKLPKCSFRITRQVINILTDCTTGTAPASAVLNRATAVIRPAAQADPAMVQNIVDMGFSRARVEETLRRVCTAEPPTDCYIIVCCHMSERVALMCSLIWLVCYTPLHDWPAHSCRHIYSQQTFHRHPVQLCAHL